MRQCPMPSCTSANKGGATSRHEPSFFLSRKPKTRRISDYLLPAFAGNLTNCYWCSATCTYVHTMKSDGLLKAFLAPVTLALAWQAWTTPRLFVSATLEQCRLDCAGNTTSELVADAALNGGTWSVWDTQRLVGPTEPAPEVNATYPFARAPFPLPFFSFCQLGCSFFFAGSPRTTTCGALCDDFYARDVSVGINDYAEKVGGGT